jgi:hypothetical protein
MVEDQTRGTRKRCGDEGGRLMPKPIRDVLLTRRPVYRVQITLLSRAKRSRTSESVKQS